MVRWLAFLCLFIVGSFAFNCAGTNTPADETSKDASSSTEVIPDTSTKEAPRETTPEASGCPPNTPKPSKPCIPTCGNELGVGMPCTRGGAECNENKKAILCTGDFNKDTDLVYCTKACVVDEDCGTGAKCTGNPDNPKAGRGCIPAACL